MRGNNPQKMTRYPQKKWISSHFSFRNIYAIHRNFLLVFSAKKTYNIYRLMILLMGFVSWQGEGGVHALYWSGFGHFSRKTLADGQ